MLSKENKVAIWVAILSVIITALLSLVLIDTNVSQEINARNVEDIPRLINEIESLKDDRDRGRDYYFDLVEKVSKNSANINSLVNGQDLLVQDFVNFKNRVYQVLISN